MPSKKQDPVRVWLVYTAPSTPELGAEYTDKPTVAFTRRDMAEEYAATWAHSFQHKTPQRLKGGGWVVGDLHIYVEPLPLDEPPTRQGFQLWPSWIRGEHHAE